MGNQMVTLEYQDRICVLTLNRPKQRNSMDEKLARDFQKAVNEVKNEPKAKVLVLTGAAGAFCAGADLTMVSRWTQAKPTILDPKQRIVSSKGVV